MKLSLFIVSSSLATRVILCQSPGMVAFQNRDPSARPPVDAPFFSENGLRLSGTNYLAQLYAGITPEYLVPVGDAVPFLTGSFSGYFFGGRRDIPFVEGGRYAWLQVRAWESAAGRTFEQSAVRGGWTGISNELYIRTFDPACPECGAPSPLIGLQYPGPPLIVRDPQDQRGRVGGTANLSVISSSGIRPFYQWYEGVSGDTNAPISGATNDVLTTPPLPATNTTFWVNVYDSAGSTNSASAAVQVFPAESVLVKLEMVARLPGLIIDALPDRTYRIQYSPSPALTNWINLVDLTFYRTPFTFIDEDARNAPNRFYRVVVP